MVQSGQITFYTHMYSPYCHRVHLALEEVHADYKAVTINVMEWPQWYNTKVNPITRKIPAITYGGPAAPPEDPSPEAVKLTESMVIVEFLADLFPGKLRPSDPVQLAYARLFIALFDTKVHEAFKGFFFLGAPVSDLLDQLEAIQARLPETGFAVGEFSIADVAAAPFLARIMLLLENDIGKYPVGEGKKAFEELQKPKFARLMKYIADLKARPSFRASYDHAQVLFIWQNNPAIQRA
ncbi:thioredoxin-like protein [Polyporus arcularius HHB13444]|uniref:Thioredoxin-like protein n=1 Tax=Polyporus arcularius HHB13444 TaxID=1314778 RepID=A0A5C3PLU6_9APHY|nr:thioredoxin-like protein [Polyporus arcularius HHB13444]